MKTRYKIPIIGAIAIVFAIGIFGLINIESSVEFNEMLTGQQNQISTAESESIAVPLEEDDFPYEDDANIKCQGNELCLTEKIVKIIDGDTIHLEGGYKIRLSLTNTPERHELGFSEAGQFTANVCPVGTRAMVDQDDEQPYDVYDRILGKVVCGNKVLNSELLYAGHANILSRYCSTSEFSDEKWAQGFGC